MDDLRRHIESVLSRSGLQAADRDDVAQETLLRLTRAQSRGLAIPDPLGFAAQTALRLVVDQWRDRTRRNGQLPRVIEASAASVVLSAERPAEVEALYAAIAKLPPRQAAVITLRKLWELDYETIAELLGISVENCRSHCRHALDHLRRVLLPGGAAGGIDHAK